MRQGAQVNADELKERPPMAKLRSWTRTKAPSFSSGCANGSVKPTVTWLVGQTTTRH